MKDRPDSSTPHLAPALVAILLLAAALFAGTFYARSVEDRNVHALAPAWLRQKHQGVALQSAAFRQADLLPLYGSSELMVQSPCQTPYQAKELFAGYPTGFTVFPIVEGGATSLIILQKLAALGPRLAGKKVVVSLAPGWFQKPMVDEEYYGGNFSRLHATGTLFNTRLDLATKRDIARRMLDYPKTFDGEPFLHFTVRGLAHDSPASRALYYIAFPLGKLEGVVLRLQDHWQTLADIRANPQPKPQHREGAIDWSTLLARAGEEYRQYSNNNPFGFENEFWKKKGAALPKHDDSSKYSSREQASKEWIDFELLLRTLHAFGARVLVLVPPKPGIYLNHLGLSEAVRKECYPRMRELGHRYHAEVVDFSDMENDMGMLVDPYNHPSPKGLVLSARTLDDFYHGRATRSSGW